MNIVFFFMLYQTCHTVHKLVLISRNYALKFLLLSIISSNLEFPTHFRFSLQNNDMILPLGRFYQINKKVYIHEGLVEFKITVMYVLILIVQVFCLIDIRVVVNIGVNVNFDRLSSSDVQCRLILWQFT